MQRSDPPPILWHYTDATGLYGIVNAARLYFGDARFLNDRTERTYGEGILRRVLEDLVAGDALGLAAPFRDLLAILRRPDRLYLCAFSASQESISQWQRYGADGAGYCIGFDAKALTDRFAMDMASLEAMLYDEDEQVELLRTAVMTSFSKYQSIEAKKESRPHSYWDYLFTDEEIDAALLRMKNPFFRDEQEWRFIVRGPECVSAELDAWDPKEQYAVRGSLVKPFLALPTGGGPRSPLPIVAVVVGPRLDPDLAFPSVSRFLDARGNGSVTITLSALASIWR